MKTSEASKNKSINPNPNLELVIGCETGNMQAIRHAFLQGADANYNNGEPLIETIYGTGNDFQKLEIMLYLEGNGAKLDVRQGGALKAATKENLLDIVKILLNLGIRDDGTSVYNAARNKNDEMLSLLLDRKIEVQDYVKESIDELEIMKEQNSPIKIMLDGYFVDNNHIIYENDSEVLAEIEEGDKDISSEQKSSPSSSYSDQRSIAGSTIEQSDHYQTIIENLQDINLGGMRNIDISSSTTVFSNKEIEPDTSKGVDQKKNTKTGQDGSLLVNNLDNSGGYQNFDLNAQFQENEPKLLSLNLTIGLKMPDIENIKEQETKEAKQEIEKNQENQKIELSQFYKPQNGTTIEDNYRLSDKMFLYVPVSKEEVISLPDSNSIISDPLFESYTVAFLSCLSLSQYIIEDHLNQPGLMVW